MYGIIFFYNEDGTIDTTHNLIECETESEYKEKCKELESYGYVKGKDFK